jgi:glycosyltransferase involved in cell wall biosynthesis
MSDPLVSILIPTYNGERFIAHAVRSALQQTYRSIEVVVADDASTDRTPEILESLAASDPRLRVIRRDRNVGGFDNPRLLLGEASGEYVKFLLHDDVLASDCVRVLLRGMQGDPDVSLAFSRRRLIDGNGRPFAGSEFPRLRDRPGIVDGRQLGDTVLRTCTNVIGELTTVLFRRGDVDPELLWQVDGRRLAVLGDAALWLRLLSGGGAFYTPEVLSSFRQHAAQSSQNPEVTAPAVRDWPLLIDWGRRHGFLGDADHEKEAHALVLLNAAHFHAGLAGAPEGAYPLEALYLSLARLIELRTGEGTATDRPLTDRAHGVGVRATLGQEVDAWAIRRPLAVASPAPDADEVAATVDALRAVRDAHASAGFVVTAPEHALPELLPLLEAALRTGPDVDLEVVPADDPAALVTGPWLAVVPRGSTWHRHRAAAIWTFDVVPGSAIEGPGG